jgi:hypothetical protein
MPMCDHSSGIGLAQCHEGDVRTINRDAAGSITDFSAWMSTGSIKRPVTFWFNLNAYARNVANVMAWCVQNPQELVMTGLARAASDMKKETP